MSKYRKQVGDWGEGMAADWLSGRGYVVCARNVRTPYGEIDIIAQQDGITIFVEVKTSTNSARLLPEQNVTPRKRQHMLQSAEYYAAEHEIDHWQVDVIAVEGKPAGLPPVIIHFENIA